MIFQVMFMTLQLSLYFIVISSGRMDLNSFTSATGRLHCLLWLGAWVYVTPSWLRCTTTLDLCGSSLPPPVPCVNKMCDSSTCCVRQYSNCPNELVTDNLSPEDKPILIKYCIEVLKLVTVPAQQNRTDEASHHYFPLLMIYCPQSALSRSGP